MLKHADRVGGEGRRTMREELEEARQQRGEERRIELLPEEPRHRAPLPQITTRGEVGVESGEGRRRRRMRVG